MLNVLRTTAAAAVLALAPLTASALPLTLGDSGGSFDLLADSYTFEQDFAVGSAGANLSYDFENTSATSLLITFFGWTVNQNLASFTGGVALNFGSYAANVAQGISDGENTSFFVGAGQTVNLAITYGDVFDTRSPNNGNEIANIDFSIEAAVVPVPAAGLMLLTALGAAAAMRRKKA